MTPGSGWAGGAALLAPALAFMIVGCGGPPAADPIPNAAPPVVTVETDGRTVQNAGPRERLRFYPDAPDHALELFGADHLDVHRAERISVGAAGASLAVRSVREFALAPVVSGQPLIERFDEAGRPLAGWGAVRGTDRGFLGELLNTGWIAATEDGGAVFAWALDAEVIRFDRAGRLVWRSVRPPARSVRVPTLVRDGRSVRPDFDEVQHGVAVGPDSRIYVLSSATADSVQVDVLDRDGEFLRTGRVARNRSVHVDGAGRVSVPSREPDTGGSERIAHDDVDLPALSGPGRVRLADHAGKAVVINVWASWCAPCRLEMPELDAFAAQVDPGEIAILGLNDDRDPQAALRFLESLGGVRYPLARGGGRLREQLGYRGLPYTVILDPEHRIVETVYGFGGSIEPVRDAVLRALGSDTP